MARKIVLFLSPLKKTDAKEVEYCCPDNTTVRGVQTNEAPVRYLLQTYPEVSEIVAVVTEATRETAWDRFVQFIGTIDSAITVTEIPYQDSETFESGPLPKILEHLGTGDKILLETTGGLRDAIMQLLLLSRILSYKGIQTECAVYSNFQKQRVEDISHLIGLFDLVGGMQELTSFGSVRTLRTYYGMPAKEEPIEELLSSLEKLTEAITLCRASQLDQVLMRFSAALSAVENHVSDALMRQLIPVFREKFGEDMSVLDLIVWCVENDMIQQALTVYTERTPELIMRQIREPAGVVVRQTAYEKDDAARFTRGFLSLARNVQVRSKNSPIKSLKNYINGNIWDFVNGRVPKCDWPHILAGVDNLVEVLEAAYPENETVFEFKWRERISPEKSFLKGMNDEKWRVGLAEMLRSGMSDQNLSLLLEGTVYTITLQNLQTLLRDSEYRLSCSVREVQDLSRDYLYIKALRNMANHANSEETVDQELLMQYLVKYGYTPLSEVTMQDVKRAILCGVERLKTISQEGVVS